MSVKAITWAIEQDVTPAGAKLLLIVLANYANDKRQCWPSKATLAADSSMSNSTVCKYLLELQQAGLISVRKRFDERFDAKALHQSSIITLNIEGVVRVADNGCPSDGQGLSEPSDNGLSDCSDTNHQLEPSIEPSSPKPLKRISYPIDFETLFWKAYPKDNNMSKAEAVGEWKKLSPEDRGAAIASLPAFKAYCVKKPDYEIIHACRYLKKRRFDGFAPAGSMDGDGTWQKRLAYARKNRCWFHEWGEMPNKPGCRCPAAILLATDGKGWTMQERVAA